MRRARSGLQGDVLSLLRSLLRAVKSKEDVTQLRSHISERFREDASSVKRSDFKKIEFMLRQGHKRVKQLNLPGTKVVSIFKGSNDLPTNNPLPISRKFSTCTVVKETNEWDVSSRPRAHIVSLGCGRNWVDSEVIPPHLDYLIAFSFCLFIFALFILFHIISSLFPVVFCLYS